MASVKGTKMLRSTLGRGLWLHRMESGQVGVAERVLLVGGTERLRNGRCCRRHSAEDEWRNEGPTGRRRRGEDGQAELGAATGGASLSLSWRRRLCRSN